MEKVTSIGRKLSALELIGPLALIVAAPDKVRGKPIRIMVDNMGSVIIWQKGYSTSCELSSTLVRAIYEVSIALECTVVLEKIARCSDSGSSMADALSKAEFVRFIEISEDYPFSMKDEMSPVPKALIEWVAHPKLDWGLGMKIIDEMRMTTNML